MGHMRIPQEVVAQRHDRHDRGGRVWRPRHGKEAEYLFTLSRWHAIKYLGCGEMVVEVKDVVEPRSAFPSRTLFNVDYGRQYGIRSRAIGFAYLGGAPAGALLRLWIDKVKIDAAGDEVPIEVDMGFYAIRYAATMNVGRGASPT